MDALTQINKHTFTCRIWAQRCVKKPSFKTYIFVNFISYLTVLHVFYQSVWSSTIEFWTFLYCLIAHKAWMHLYKHLHRIYECKCPPRIAPGWSDTSTEMRKPVTPIHTNLGYVTEPKLNAMLEVMKSKRVPENSRKNKFSCMADYTRQLRDYKLTMNLSACNERSQCSQTIQPRVSSASLQCSREDIYKHVL